MAGDAHVVISPGSDYVRITSGMEFGAHDAPGPLPSAIARMRRHAEMTVPGLRDLPRDGVAWRGARPMTPTGVPIMRPIADNLIAAVGHNTQGMTLGPIAGRTVAEHVDGVLGSHRAKPTTLRGEPAVPSVHAYTPDGEPAPLAPYNTVCTYGDLVFLGGHLPLGPDGELLSHLSPSDQTTNAMEHLRVSLRSAGSDFDYLLKVTIYATSLDDFAEINKAYAEFFTGHLPARATIQAGRLIGGVALEIEAIAARRTD
jgi:reactive intermediate/imine deaminase